MLTKDLIKARLRNERIYPLFLDPENSECLAEASAWIDLASDCVGNTVGTSEIRFAEFLSPKQMAGGAFAKLLGDRFVPADIDESVASRRRELIAVASQKRAMSLTRADWREAVETHFSQPFEELANGLYADLPGERTIASFETLTPAELINRQNVAQLQGLLLRAESVRVVLEKASAAEKRFLFRVLKFHRLIPGELADSPGSGLSFTLGGPLSLFGPGAGYGVAICNFVPNLFHLAKWRLEADVRYRERNSALRINETSGYRVLSGRAPGHVPEEFAHFIAAFNARFANEAPSKSNRSDSGAWRAAVADEVLVLGAGQWVVPDFVLEKLPATKSSAVSKTATGRRIHVELFHRWHEGQLTSRLDHVEGMATGEKSGELILGISKGLVRSDAALAARLASPLLAGRTFLFNDFPTPAGVAPLLAQASA